MESETGKPETKWLQKLQVEFTKPATIIGVVFAAIGLLGGYYFYLLTEKVGRLSFIVEQVQVFDQTRIAPDQGKTSAGPGVARPLTVHDRQGNVIYENVYAANIKVWNSGRREIKKDDVREQFKILISPAATVLDSTIVSATNKNADRFDLGPPPDLRLTWEHFDPREGVVVRLVYVAGSMSDVKLEGHAVEIGSPIRYSEGGTQLSGIGYNVEPVFGALIGGALASVSIWVPWLVISRRRIVIAVVVVCVAALGVLAFYPFVVVAGPPF